MKKLLYQIVPKLKYLGMCAAMAIALAACSKDDVSEQSQVNPTPEPTPESTVSPDFLPIDWDETEIQSMDLNTGEFSLNFNGGGMPAFRDSFSLVVLQTDTSAYLRRVMDTQISGNTATLKTIEATMDEVFSNTEFTLAIGEDGDSRIVSSQGNVYAPVKIVQIYEDNSYEVIYDKSQSRNNYVEIDPKIPIPLFYINWSGQSLNAKFGDLSTASLSLKAEQFVHSLTNTLLMDFKFGPAVNVKEITKDFKVKVSDIESFYCKSSLDFVSRMRLDLSTSKGFSKDDKIDILKPLYWFYTYFIGPVPVFLTQNVGLNVGYDIGIEESASARLGYEMNGNFTMGVEYKKGGQITPVINHSFSSQVYPLEFQLNSPSIYAKFSIYPEVDLKVYGVIGPSFSIRPFAEGRLYTGHIIPQFFGWSNQLNLGIDAQIGGEIAFLGLKDGLELSFTQEIAKKEVYRAPKYIRLSRPANGTKVEIGQSVLVNFSVTSEQIPLLSSVGKEEPVSMALVHFKSTNGTIVGKEYAITDENGNVEVEWIPTEEGASLTAVILDQDGTELDDAIFTPNAEEETGSIVGTWEKVKIEVKTIYHGKVIQTTTSSPSDYGYRDFWVLRADGTIDGYDTDAVAWPYGTYTYTGGTLNIHYLNDGGSTEIAPIIKLTESELVTRDIAVDPDDDSNMQIGLTYYVRVTDQALIDQIDRATANNPAKWWH